MVRQEYATRCLSQKINQVIGKLENKESDDEVKIISAALTELVQLIAERSVDPIILLLEERLRNGLWLVKGWLEETNEISKEVWRRQALGSYQDADLVLSRHTPTYAAFPSQ